MIVQSLRWNWKLTASLCLFAVSARMKEANLVLDFSFPTIDFGHPANCANVSADNDQIMCTPWNIVLTMLTNHQVDTSIDFIFNGKFKHFFFNFRIFHVWA